MVTTHRLHRIGALLAVAGALSACGGGGGDDGGSAAAPAPGSSASAQGSPPAAAPAAPAPTAAPAPAPGTQALIRGDTQAVANGDYAVVSSEAAPVTITLPPNATLTAGDTVRIVGVGQSAWQIAQNAGQSVLTSTLGGNVAPGVNWVASTMPPAQWHWVSSSVDGQVLVAADIPGTLHVSTNGGATWTAVAALPVANWIGVDMTPDGQRMVAVAFEGDMYTSADRGATWTRVTSATVPLTQRQYESVTISDDGLRIAAVILNGELVQSRDGGATWTSAGAALVKPWRAIDSSADGSTLVAVSQSVAGPPAAVGEVYLSTDAGATWRPVTIASAPEGWYRARISRDGNVIAVATNGIYAGGGNGMFVSRNRGATWSPAGPANVDYTGIAMSETGSVIGATISNGITGSVQYSTDSGATFRPLTLPSGTDTNFRHIAMDRFGTKLTVVTGTFSGTPGQLYTSIGDRTSSGASGAITGGGAGEAIVLRYEGNGLFRVSSSTGTFAVR